MKQPRVCEDCGGALPSHAPEGLCPKCLLRLGATELGVEVKGTGSRPPENGSPRAEDRDQKSSGGGRSSAGNTVGSAQVATRHSPLATRFGDYKLLAKIGQGGMGVVYRARQVSLGRLVALKLLPFGPFSRDDAVQRFRAEAAAAAALQHPNIVAIHEVGEQAGQHYFAMDFVEGRTLAEAVQEKALPARQAAAYLKTIAEAVQYAHEQGIIHRDLKPSNILIDQNDQPRITDFGLAKRWVAADARTLTGSDSPASGSSAATESQSLSPSAATDLTVSGQVLGSPNYLPPEQAQARRGEVGPVSDVYSLGAILYHLVSGRPPFQADSLTTLLRQVMETEPVRPRLLNASIPRDLETICLKCLEKEPSRRYSTAQDLATDLGRFLEKKPIQARPVGAAGKAWKWCRRRPAMAGMGAALVLTFMLGLAGVLWQWHRAATGELLARQNAQAEFRQRYAADMHLAQLALEQDNRPLAVNLLDKYRPLQGSEISNLKSQIDGDLRGWEWRYLWQLCHGDELFTLRRYPRLITALAVSKEGKVLAVATSDEVALWGLTTRRPLKGLPIRATPALAFSPTVEHLLAVGTRNAAGQPVAELWDVNAGKVAGSLPHEGRVKSLAFSPDGQMLATFDSTGKIRIADWASGQLLTNFDVPPIRNTDAGVVVFSPDGRQLAIGEDYGRLRLLDLQTGTFVTCPTQTPASINTLAFSPDSELVAAGLGYSEGTIGLWDTRSGEPRGRLTHHTDDVMALAFTADGRQLASASMDGTIRFWSLADGTQRHLLQSSGEGLRAMTLLPDGRTNVTGGLKGSICFWDAMPKGQTPVQTNLAVWPQNESLHGLERPAFESATLDPRAVHRVGLAFMPDSRSFLTMEERTGALARWDARSWRRLETLPALGSNHWAVALSSDGHWLATGDFPGRVTLRDWTTRRAVTNFAVPFQWIGMLRFSRSGHYLIATMIPNDYAASVRVWRTGDWVAAPLTGSQFQHLWAADLSPDDRLLAVGYPNGAVKLLRFPSAELEATLGNHQEGVASVLFSPDGRWLASTSFDSSSRLWDVAARRQLASLQGHFADVIGSAFSPDGHRLATGGSRARDAVKLWDLRAHRELLSLHAPGKYFVDLAFSPDGNTLAATSLSGIVHLWRAPSWAEIEAVESTRKQASEEPED